MACMVKAAFISEQLPGLAAHHWSQVCCRHLADAGVVEALVPLLQTQATEACDVAAVALAHMSLHEEVRRRVCAAGAIPLLVRGLPNFGSRGIEGAAVCLEKLVAMREAADQMAGEPVCPRPLYTASAMFYRIQWCTPR